MRNVSELNRTRYQLDFSLLSVGRMDWAFVGVHIMIRRVRILNLPIILARAVQSGLYPGLAARLLHQRHFSIQLALRQFTLVSLQTRFNALFGGIIVLLEPADEFLTVA